MRGNFFAVGEDIWAKMKRTIKVEQAMVGRIIKGEACLAEGAAWLAGQDAVFARALAATGPLPMRQRSAGFDTLLGAIVSQQVSVASARAIMSRLRAAGFDQAQSVAAADDAMLRACGLSRQKVRYAQALARAGIDYDALTHQPTDVVIAHLVQVPGIGRWTAEIYAMFSLGRADVFAPADLALQEGARLLFDLPARPTERDLRAMALAWSPWRSVAAQVLWAYYAVAKQRDGTA